MKTFSLLTIVSTLLVLIACTHNKKAVATTAAANSSSTQTAGVPAVGPLMAAKPANGVYMPGDEEVNAIKPRYDDVNLEILKRGYGIYMGQCRDCHEVKNIYQYTEMEWGQIMTDMALRAHLNESEKTAVWQYVMAVRAVKSDKK